MLMTAPILRYKGRVQVDFDALQQEQHYNMMMGEDE
jgi:hypothetical protein